MTSARLIGLSEGSITISIKKANVLVAELDDIYHRSHKMKKGGTKNAISTTVLTPYIYKIVSRANLIEGIPCAKCDEMIKPDEYCYVKYKHNNRINSIPSYYHQDCWNSLYL